MEIEQKDQIIDIIELYSNNIDIEKIDLFIRKAVIKPSIPMEPYGNSFTLAEWINHFEKEKFNTSENELKLIFNYLIKHNKNFLYFKNSKYTLEKNFNEINLDFEKIIFLTIKLFDNKK